MTQVPCWRDASEGSISAPGCAEGGGERILRAGDHLFSALEKLGKAHGRLGGGKFTVYGFQFTVGIAAEFFCVGLDNCKP